MDIRLRSQIMYFCCLISLNALNVVLAFDFLLWWTTESFHSTRSSSYPIKIVGVSDLDWRMMHLETCCTSLWRCSHSNGSDLDWRMMHHIHFQTCLTYLWRCSHSNGSDLDWRTMHFETCRSCLWRCSHSNCSDLDWKKMHFETCLPYLWRCSHSILQFFHTAESLVVDPTSIEWLLPAENRCRTEKFEHHPKRFTSRKIWTRAILIFYTKAKATKNRRCPGFSRISIYIR